MKCGQFTRVCETKTTYQKRIMKMNNIGLKPHIIILQKYDFPDECVKHAHIIHFFNFFTCERVSNTEGTTVWRLLTIMKLACERRRKKKQITMSERKHRTQILNFDVWQTINISTKKIMMKQKKKLINTIKNISELILWRQKIWFLRPIWIANTTCPKSEEWI